MTPFSDEHMKRIERDPVGIRQYFWACAMNMRHMAAENRKKAEILSVCHPVTNYRPVFAEGYDLLKDAEWMERVADTIFEHMDALVNSSVKWD